MASTPPLPSSGLTGTKITKRARAERSGENNELDPGIHKKPSSLGISTASNEGFGPAEAADNRMPVHDDIIPAFDTLAQMSVPLKNSELRLAQVTLRYMDAQNEPQCLIVTRVVLAPIDQPECAPRYAYDLDIATLVYCQRWLRDPHANTALACSPAFDCPVLILRKGFLLRKVQISGSQVRLPCLPTSLTVSGKVYRIRQAVDPNGMEARCVFGFPEDDPMVSGDHPREPLLMHTQQIPCPHGPPLEYTTLFDATDQGVLLPAAAGHLSLGEELFPQPYGEVYEGQILVEDTEATAATPIPTTLLALRTRDKGAVAVKVVRYGNTHLPHASEQWYADRSPQLIPTDPLVEHVRSGAPVPAGGQLYSKDTAWHFAGQDAAENPMSEVEMVTYAHQEVERAAQQQPDLSLLQGRFLAISEAGVSADNLHVVTQFAPFGSLDRYMGRAPGLNNPLSERCAKHVVRHLLQALALLHARGVAHLDISLGNTLLRTMTEEALQLLPLAKKHFLSEAQFLLLDAALIDFGMAAAHPAYVAPLPVASPTVSAVETASERFAAMGLGAFSSGEDAASERDDGQEGVPTAVSQGSLGGATDSESLSPRTPLNTKEGIRRSARTSSAVSVAVPPTALNSFYEEPPSSTQASAPPPLQRWYDRLPPAERRLGKESYCPPELQFLATDTVPPGGIPAAPFCGMCVDMWQLGVLCMNLLVGTRYFDFIFKKKRAKVFLDRQRLYAHARAGTLRAFEVGRMVRRDRFNMMPLSAVAPSDLAMDLLERLLTHDPAQRLTAEQALQHPWFSAP